MTNESKLDISLISIVSMRTLKGNIEISNEEILKTLNKIYTFKIKIDTNIDSEKKLVRNITEIKIENIDINRNPTGLSGSFTNEFIYKIINLEDLVTFDEEHKNAVVDFDLAQTLASLSYSTMRGVIHTRTQGTVLDGVIIPVVDARLLLQPLPTELQKSNTEEVKSIQ